jgi:predicted lipoprotein with Yx(FWY)xxD motif
MVVSGAIAAAFLLPGCAPAGVTGGGYDAGAAPDAQPAANAEKVEASPSADAGAEKQEEQDSPELTDEELTNELVAKDVARMGKTVQDENGWVLYRFDDDKIDPPTSNCDGDCAKIWPPALTDGNPKLEGVDQDLVGTIERKDGTKQITLGDWPLYRYIGDKKPGQWKGQNVGGKWFVVQPDGKKNLTCLPPVSKPVAPPKDDKDKEKGKDKDKEKGKEESSGEGSGSGSDYSY